MAAQLGLFMPPLDASDEAVFFADVRNCRVRRVSLATGTITTIAGHGEAATGTAQEIGDGLPALQAGLSTHPMRLALDPRGNILVSDAHQNRIRRIDAQTGDHHTRSRDVETGHDVGQRPEGVGVGDLRGNALAGMGDSPQQPVVGIAGPRRG